MYAASSTNGQLNGKLDCLEHLVMKGANVNATANVSTARQPAPTLFSLALRPCRS